jgi:membrane-bound acyltransferase YfiQ involved in biofilm formation
VAAPERTETESERLDRQLDQLLQELRVAMPGVQVLFAFLLAVPFQQRFEKVTEFQKDVYFVTLLAAAAASAFFIAPTAFHRIRFQDRDKPFLVAMSSKLMVAGLACLAIAMTGAVLLVSDVLFDGAAVTITVAITGALYVGMWFVLAGVREVLGKRSH